MKEIKELDTENSCIHFTDAQNLESIFQNGLLPLIGRHSAGVEKTAKSFFTVGFHSSLMLYDIWIKYLLYMKQLSKYTEHCLKKYGMDSNYNQYLSQAISLLNEEFVMGKFFTPENIQEIFENFYNQAKNRVVLSLKLTAGEDYDENDVDEFKQKKTNDQKFLSYMYGKGLTKDLKHPYKMEKWNMHTKTGHKIGPEKIEQLAINNKTDMMSILMYMYEQEKNKDFEFLNEFMEFAKAKEARCEA